MSQRASTAMSIITCPNCQAQYQVAPDMIGDKGRNVRCAQCHKDWIAIPQTPEQAGGMGPEVDVRVTPDEEDALDAAFSEAEGQVPDLSEGGAKSEPGPQGEAETDLVDVREVARKRREMKKRHVRLSRNLPRARMRRGVRIAGGVILAVLFLSGLFLRENIVRALPDLAGVYAALGLEVNVVGLEFRDVKTLRTLRDGVEVLQISAGIASIDSHQVLVPPVIVTLLDEAGNSVFEWSVASKAAVLLPGEWVDFETQLASPPGNAVNVQLTFEHIK